MTTLRMAYHTLNARRIVEVRDDLGVLLATITPTDDGSNTIRIVSNYVESIELAPRSTIPADVRIVKFKEREFVR